MAPGTLSGFPYDWQGLEASGLAILAAVIGGLFTRRQTNQTGQHKSEEDGRRLRAARTAMPLTLSTLDDYAEQSASYLAHHYGMPRVHGGGGPVPTDMPTISADAISSLDRLVQAGSEALSECVSDLLGDLQVFAARMRSLARTGTSKPVRPLAAADARTYVIDIGVVAARIAALYDYGRRKSDAVPEAPSWDDVWKALKLKGFDEDPNPDRYATVTARTKRGVPIGHLDKDGSLNN